MQEKNFNIDPWYSNHPSFWGRSPKDLKFWGRSWKTPKVQFEVLQKNMVYQLCHENLSIYHTITWIFCHGSWFTMQFRSKKRPIYKKNMQNLARSRHPTDLLHIFNLPTRTCIYTCKAHVLVSAIVWTRLFSLLTPLFFHGFLTEFSRTFGVFVDTFGSLLILLGSCSRKPHGYFTVVLLFPQQLKGSENSQCLLPVNGRNHWIYGQI